MTEHKLQDTGSWWEGDYFEKFVLTELSEACFDELIYRYTPGQVYACLCMCMHAQGRPVQACASGLIQD